MWAIREIRTKAPNNHEEQISFHGIHRPIAIAQGLILLEDPVELRVFQCINLQYTNVAHKPVAPMHRIPGRRKQSQQQAQRSSTRCCTRSSRSSHASYTPSGPYRGRRPTPFVPYSALRKEKQPSVVKLQGARHPTATKSASFERRLNASVGTWFEGLSSHSPIIFHGSRGTANCSDRSNGGIVKTEEFVFRYRTLLWLGLIMASSDGSLQDGLVG